MLKTNSYASQHIRKQSFDRGSLVALGLMEPDKLLTDRAAYVTYLEAQLDRVTTALLTSQANGDSSLRNDNHSLPVRQKAQLRDALDLIADEQRRSEKQEELTKKAVSSLAKRIGALEEGVRGLGSHREEAAEDEELRRREALRQAVACEVAEAMAAWRPEHRAALDDLRRSQDELRGLLESAKAEKGARDKESSELESRLVELLEAVAEEARAAKEANKAQSAAVKDLAAKHDTLSTATTAQSAGAAAAAAEVQERLARLEALAESLQAQVAQHGQQQHGQQQHGQQQHEQGQGRGQEGWDSPPAPPWTSPISPAVAPNASTDPRLSPPSPGQQPGSDSRSSSFSFQSTIPAGHSFAQSGGGGATSIRTMSSTSTVPNRRLQEGEAPRSPSAQHSESLDATQEVDPRLAEESYRGRSRARSAPGRPPQAYYEDDRLRDPPASTGRAPLREPRERRHPDTAGFPPRHLSDTGRGSSVGGSERWLQLGNDMEDMLTQVVSVRTPPSQQPSRRPEELWTGGGSGSASFHPPRTSDFTPRTSSFVSAGDPTVSIRSPRYPDSSSNVSYSRRPDSSSAPRRSGDRARRGPTASEYSRGTPGRVGSTPGSTAPRSVAESRVSERAAERRQRLVALYAELNSLS